MSMELEVVKTNFLDLKRTMPLPNNQNSVKCVVFLKDGSGIQIRKQEVVDKILLFKEQYDETPRERMTKIYTQKYESRLVKFVIKNVFEFEKALIDDRTFKESAIYKFCIELEWPEMCKLRVVASYLQCSPVNVGIALVLDDVLKGVVKPQQKRIW